MPRSRALCYLRRQDKFEHREHHEHPMARKNEDLIRKLIQIQEQARITMEELPMPQKLARDRLKLVVGLAGYVATALQLEERAPEVAPLPEEPAPRKTLQ
jgi:hypothetical protein